MQIVSRKDWGARAPRSVLKTTWSKRTEFIVHHSAGPTSQTIRSIQDFHMDGREWSDIGYNFLVDDEGTIFEGRGWLVIGAQAEGHNTSGIGVCYIGQNSPTTAAKQSIRALYDEANKRAKKTLAKRCHCDVNSTDCPGSNLKAWVHDGMPVSAGTPDEGEELMAGLPTLKPGSKGYDVKTVRWLLGARGYPPDNLWSFDYDNALGLKVNEFKKAKGLPTDMVWGDNAWKAALLPES